MGDWWQKNWKIVVYAVICVLIFGVIVYIFGIRPNQQLEEAKVRLQPKEFLELKNNIRTALAQAIGGAILLIGLFFTWRNIRATEKNVEIAQQNIRLSQDTAAKNLAITQKNLEITQENIRHTQENTAKTIAISVEGQITDRFMRATEQLGNNQSLAMRLGGIYSLERIAHDSERDHWTVMEVLTAYVRHKSQWKGNVETDQNEPAKLRSDVQAILTVLGRRNLEYEKTEAQTLSLIGADLRSGRFDKGYFGKLDLTQAHLEGASLRGVVLEKAGFYGAYLSGANFAWAELKEADFTWAQFDDQTVLNHATMNKAKFNQARMVGTSLSFAKLDGANFSNADMERAQLSNASLESAILFGTNLKDAVLFNASLKQTTVLNTNMEDATLFNAKLDGARLENVNFAGAKGLTLEQLKSTFFCKVCVVPKGLSGSTANSSTQRSITES